MSHVLRIFGTLSLSLPGILAVSFSPANAAQIQLNANAPHLCVAVQGSNTAPGTAVIAYSCSGGPNDRRDYFAGQLEGLGSGANGATMCLDVVEQGTVSGTLVDLWPCNSQQNQQWLIQNGSIIGVQSGKCLDSAGPAVNGGTQLVTNTCTGVTSKNWIVR